MMGRRPKDFGPDDWTGGDPEDDAIAIKMAQERWDKAYSALPWWLKIYCKVFG